MTVHFFDKQRNYLKLTFAIEKHDNMSVLIFGTILANRFFCPLGKRVKIKTKKLKKEKIYYGKDYWY